jgi:Protein of unknown function (DUF3089)
VWLCRPGAAKNPCAVGLTATSVKATGARSTQPATDSTDLPFDCFYIYPTVSTEPGLNADLKVQPAEVDVAVEQAARFSQVCRVWAPMYRQVTTAGLEQLTSLIGGEQTAYASVLSAWQDYLAHDNDGRPVVFIGHSQGASMLIDLLREQIDNDAALRSRTVSAIIVGGNVQVPNGQTVGGSFQHLPLCTAAAETGCVIAYSTFDKTPPADSLFGRPGTGVSLLSDQTTSTGQQVACVNPANLSSAGTTAGVSPYFATAADGGRTAAWTTYPGLYSVRCRSQGGATWLQIKDVGSSHDRRPRVSDTLGAIWGLHLYDVNIALGNLVEDVRQQEQAYAASH